MDNYGIKLLFHCLNSLGIEWFFYTYLMSKFHEYLELTPYSSVSTYQGFLCVVTDRVWMETKVFDFDLDLPRYCNLTARDWWIESNKESSKESLEVYEYAGHILRGVTKEYI